MKAVKTMKQLEGARKPTTKDKYVGVEIECISPLCYTKMGKELLKQDFKNHITLKTDTSIEYSAAYNDLEKCICGKCCDCGDCNIWCERYKAGIEICVLATQKEIKGIISKVCKFLKDKECAVNDTCGLHVHLDMRHRQEKQSFNNLIKVQDMLFKISPTRFDNSNCKMLEDDMTLDKALSLGWEYDRYTSVNARALEEHHTIEVRTHEGTIEAKDINNFIDFLVGVVDTNNIEKPISTVSELKKNLKLSRKTQAYLLHKQRRAA